MFSLSLSVLWPSFFVCHILSFVWNYCFGSEFLIIWYIYYESTSSVSTELTKPKNSPWFSLMYRVQVSLLKWHSCLCVPRNGLLEMVVHIEQVILLTANIRKLCWSTFQLNKLGRGKDFLADLNLSAIFEIFDSFFWETFLNPMQWVAFQSQRNNVLL